MANEQNLSAPWQPGQSGNPGGKTSAQRLLEVQNAEKATRIHGALLDQFVALIEGGVTLDLEANLLKLVKDAQDRGLGQPKAEVEQTGTMKHEFVTIYEAKPET
jgi:hypothetical protein